MSDNSNSFWPVIGTLVGVLIGSAVSVGTTYWITYQGVERPKFELESKKAELDLRKTSIEIHKQALALTPNVGLSCSSNAIDPWKWKIICSAKNLGTYPADIAITDAKVTLSSDSKEVLYQSGDGFTIEDPNKKQSFRATPGVTGDLWFYIVFDRQRYKGGVNRSDLVARVMFSFQTIQTASNYVAGQFPELQGLIGDITKYGSTVWVQMPYASPSQ